MVTMPGFQQHNLSESFCFLLCLITIWRVNVSVTTHRSPPLGDYISMVKGSVPLAEQPADILRIVQFP